MRISRLGGTALTALAVLATMTYAAARSDAPDPSSDRVDAAVTGASTQARAGKRPQYLNRVVIARMYQTGSWTIPAVKDASPEQKIAYVCDALAYLKPTFVSGLVRLDQNESAQRLAEQARIFDGVRTCVRQKTHRNVKFDVVLNALHYTDPDEVVDSETGTKRIRERLRTAQEAFQPDGWYFDFYASPLKPGSGRFAEPLKEAIRWIHDKKEDKPRQFVGGTVWGTEIPIPEHSDYLAITDRGGPGYTRKLAHDLESEHTPLLMHIDNSPTDPDSQSSRFYRGDRDRSAVIRQQVRDQKVGYRYMFPVFFPTRYKSVNVFDMREHPTLFETMCATTLDHCGTPPGALEQGSAARPTKPTKPARPAKPATERTEPTLRPIYRGYHRQTLQHLYSVSEQEITQAPSLRFETASAFYLATEAGPGLSPLHRCFLGRGWHVLIPGSGCEGVTGAIDEGPLGHLATTRLPGTVPLYRMFRPAKPDHFYTTSAAERAQAAANGYRDEHIAGYVWTTPTAPDRLAENTVTAKGNPVKRVCKASAAVRRNGHTIGHLYRGDKLEVIRPVYDHGGTGIEIVAYYGFARGSVNAKGTVRAGAFC